MNLQQLQKELSKLRDKGYVTSLRRGPTGIGYTLERELNLKENNVAIPDVGGRVELKASRRNVSSLITLFTFNRGVWQIPQKTVIENHGYQDQSGRLALYNLVRVGEVNTQGLTLRIDEKKNEVHLTHESSPTLIAIWSVYTIVGKFLNKTERLLLVLADSKLRQDRKEEFHFNEAYLLTDPKPQNFIEAFSKGIIVIDIRMHLKSNKTVRNHGTGFRIREVDIPLLYATRRNLI
jgi:hypothetical protein